MQWIYALGGYSVITITLIYIYKAGWAACVCVMVSPSTVSATTGQRTGLRVAKSGTNSCKERDEQYQRLGLTWSKSGTNRGSEQSEALEFGRDSRMYFCEQPSTPLVTFGETEREERGGVLGM